MITLDDELRYNLPRLPDAPFCGVKEAALLQREYEAYRAWYRAQPHVPKDGDR